MPNSALAVVSQRCGVFTRTASRWTTGRSSPVALPMQVYTHHFVTVDTLMVPPPTGQGLMTRPAFSEQHRLLVPANMLQSEISR